MVKKPLRDRLAQAGIFDAGAGFPLAGDAMAYIVQALCVEIGSNYPWEKYAEWAALLEKLGWDGTFDGAAWTAQTKYDNQALSGENYLNALYYIYARPFLLLDRWRRTQAEYAGRIAEIQAENEKLRQTLSAERTMKDGHQ